MALTNAELLALDFGYLTGADLAAWVNFTLLISQHTKNAASLQQACDFAIAEVTGNANTTYNMAAEFATTGDDRSKLCVKITSIIACRNAVANILTEGDQLFGLFKWADAQVLALRNGQLNIPAALPVVDDETLVTPYSENITVDSSFRTLG
jgi:hypothetical protein